MASSTSLPAQLMADNDQARLSKLLARTFGLGFKLAMIEIVTPRDRVEILRWLEPQLHELNAQPVFVNLGELLGSSPQSFNVWQALHQHVPPDSLPPRPCLVLFGFEDVMYEGRVDRSELLQQFNTQRDLLVRDYPCFWLAFIHHRSRDKWQLVAPDFCDFVSVWAEASPPTQVAMSSDFDSAFRIQRPMELYHSASMKTWPQQLQEASDLIVVGRYDEALDQIHSFMVASNQEATRHERDASIAAMLETDIKSIRGSWAESLERLRSDIAPVFERLNDELLVAEARERIAALLSVTGDPSSALAIYRDEVLPIYERHGDEQSQAVTKKNIAIILRNRGESDEAADLFEEVLHRFEQLGDLRNYAITLRQIANIKKIRGEIDDALNILKERAIPIFEQLGDIREQAGCLAQVSVFNRDRGNLEAAELVLRNEVLPIAEELDDAELQATTWTLIAQTIRLQNRMDEALRLFQKEVQPRFEKLNAVREIAVTRGEIAKINFEHGEIDAALEILQNEVLPTYSRIGEVRGQVWAQGQVAIIEAMRGNLRDATRQFREVVLPAAEELGDVQLLVWVRRDTARVLWQRNEGADRRRATELMNLALADAERLKLPEAKNIRDIMRKAGIPRRTA